MECDSWHRCGEILCHSVGDAETLLPALTGLFLILQWSPFRWAFQLRIRNDTMKYHLKTHIYTNTGYVWLRVLDWQRDTDCKWTTAASRELKVSNTCQQTVAFHMLKGHDPVSFESFIHLKLVQKCTNSLASEIDSRPEHLWWMAAVKIWIPLQQKVKRWCGKPELWPFYLLNILLF